MRHKKAFRYFRTTLVIVAIGWGAITFYAESQGPAKEWTFGPPDGTKALIVYDPDPFNSLDEKVCKSFAEGLAEKQMNVRVATVAAAQKIDRTSFDIFIYCANTYNWRPDWSITEFVNQQAQAHSGKPVVAITVGAGATESSLEYFEDVIAHSGGKIVKSYALWQWRPNEDAKDGRKNVTIALDKASEWGRQLAETLKN